MTVNWPEKLTYVPPNYPPDTPQGFIFGWNKCIDAYEAALAAEQKEQCTCGYEAHGIPCELHRGNKPAEPKLKKLDREKLLEVIQRVCLNNAKNNIVNNGFGGQLVPTMNLIDELYKEFGQPETLKKLDKKQMLEMLFRRRDTANLSWEIEFVDELYEKYGQPATPSVESIEQIINDLTFDSKHSKQATTPKLFAQAIHALLAGKDGE